jgi:hypothetical protein
MTDQSWLTPAQIADVFTDQITVHGGTVTDAFDVGAAGGLFTRAVLAQTTEVRPGDRLRGGVALRATETDIFVHPYVFRLVCSNGAIMAQATQTRRISRDDWFVQPNAEGDLPTTLRTAITCSCEPAAFTTAVQQMRTAQERAVDIVLTLAGFLARHSRGLPDSLVSEIFRRYDRAADQSAYGFMNAVTSVARDTRDPDLRWRLEELGGGIPALQARPASMPPRTRARVRTPVEVA